MAYDDAMVKLSREEIDKVMREREERDKALDIEEWRRETKEECREFLKSPYGKKLLREMKDISNE